MTIIRRIKAKLKEMVEKNKKISPTPKTAVTASRKTAPATKSISERIFGRKTTKQVQERPKQEFLGETEVSVGKAKFYTGQVVRAPRVMPQELPYQYDRDRNILQVRDPWWLHCYWEVRTATWERLKYELKDDFYRAQKVLRVYDVTSIIFDGTNAHRFFDIQINEHATNWYIDSGGSGRSWCVDYGLLLPDGRFITIVRSNTVTTPIEGPSWITDEEWMIPEEMFARLYGMGFGLGRSSPVGKAWQERVRRQLYSGAMASPGLASMASPVKKAKERKFWMVVNTELILYGATEPDATVYVQDREIKLRPDGTFSLRFALPDGKQVIPVKGISADRQEERVITPIVTRETK